MLVEGAMKSSCVVVVVDGWTFVWQFPSRIAPQHSAGAAVPEPSVVSLKEMSMTTTP
jgi:hypothetical protein